MGEGGEEEEGGGEAGEAEEGFVSFEGEEDERGPAEVCD